MPPPSMDLEQPQPLPAPLSTLSDTTIDNTPSAASSPLQKRYDHPGRYWVGIFIGLCIALLFLPPLAPIVLPAFGLSFLLVTSASAVGVITSIGEAIVAFLLSNLVTHALLALTHHFKIARKCKAALEYAGLAQRWLLFAAFVIPLGIASFCFMLVGGIIYSLPFIKSFYEYVLWVALLAIGGPLLLIKLTGKLLEGIGLLCTPLASAITQHIHHHAVWAKGVYLFLSLFTIPCWILVGIGQSLWKVATLTQNVLVVHFLNKQPENEITGDTILLPQKASPTSFHSYHEKEESAKTIFEVLDDMHQGFEEDCKHYFTL